MNNQISNGKQMRILKLSKPDKAATTKREYWKT